jgi:hypothetical protein
MLVLIVRNVAFSDMEQPERFGVPNQTLWNTGIELLKSGSVPEKSCLLQAALGMVGGTGKYKLKLSLYTP